VNKKQVFLRKLLPYAIKVSLATDFDPVILLAHAALETGWNPTGFNNNLYGIKDLPWEPGKVVGETTEYIDGVKVRLKDAFEDFESPLDSMLGYVILIRRSKRYKKAWEYGCARDYKRYFKELQKAGYATDPKFADKCIAVYKTVQRELEKMKIDLWKIC